MRFRQLSPRARATTPMFLHGLMPDWSVDFDAPRYLFLLALLPLIWFIGRHSLGALTVWRRRMALLLRLGVATLIIVALAEPNWLSIVHRLTVLFVVDTSDSIRRDEVDSALKYVNAASQQRDAARGDRAGLVVFGRNPAVEVPPVPVDWHVAHVESKIDQRFSNLEQALRLATVTLPADSARRVVLISDGNENIGRALAQAATMLASGIGIDCIPISYDRQGEVAVEKVTAPADIRRKTPFTLNVVLNSLSDHSISGKLRITREHGGTRDPVVDEAIALAPGKRVLSIRQELADSGMNTYEARLIPDNPADDAHSENNVATAFTRVRGNGHLLLVEDSAQPGRFDHFVDLLRKNDLEVTVRDTRRPFDGLADLEQFDCVILADAPRLSGDGAAELTQFSDQQVHELVQNTEHFGCGLVVLGGPNSYGAGGWTNTELEKALPVDCQIQATKVNAVGALMLVIDSSGSMGGEKIAWSRAAAVATSQMLGSHDFIGVVTFDSEAHWILPLRRNSNPQQTRARLDRIAASGGTNMMPALREAYQAIRGCDASMKHVIVLTDGQTPRDNYGSLVSQMQKLGITTTSVAVGRDADRTLLSEIALRGAGKFYQVVSPNVIPKIFMREARRVAKPLVFEDNNGIAVNVVANAELLGGLRGPAPPISGYVLTTLKENSLVDVVMSTPRQPQPNSAILATWQYGLGRAVALTTDVGERWAKNWPQWEEYDKLILQTVRWSMRSHDLDDRLALSTDPRDGAIDVVVNALDRQDNNLNYLNLIGSAILPNGQSHEISFRQAAPGRYTAKVPAEEPGNYFLAISDGRGSALVRAAVNVANTAELDKLTSYDGFLAELAEGKPKGGEPGKLIQAAGGIADTAGLLKTDVFRPGVAAAKSRSPMWPIVLVAAGFVFLSDVFCRRVHISFDWIAPLVAGILRSGERSRRDNESPQMERLRRSKSGATAYYTQAAKKSRFESSTTDVVDSIEPAPPSALAGTPPRKEDELPSPDFTARLLEVKKQMRDQRPPGE
jgi:Mg-chelatase subunit ChlD